MPEDEAQRKTDLALRRYDVVFRYLAYENSVYWTRAQFFLLANTALAAFVLNQIPTSSMPPVTWNRLWVIALASLTGVTLTWLWRSALETGEHWIRHWQEILIGLEGDAFADLLVVRKWEFVVPPPAPKRSRSAKQLAHWLANLFRAVWSLGFLYVVFLGWAKWIGWQVALSN